MLLARESHRQLEEFFRAYLLSPDLKLPLIHLHCNLFTSFIIKRFGASAVTFGCHIVVAGRLIERDATNRLIMPASLMVHETRHVIQYAETGFVKFIARYVWGYWQGVRRCEKWNADAHRKCYLDLEEEREARAAEAAYAMWRREERARV